MTEVKEGHNSLWSQFILITYSSYVMWWKVIWPPLRKCTEKRAESRSSDHVLPGPSQAHHRSLPPHTKGWNLPLWSSLEGFLVQLLNRGVLLPVSVSDPSWDAKFWHGTSLEMFSGGSKGREEWDLRGLTGNKAGKTGRCEDKTCKQAADHCASVAVPCTWWVQPVQSSH